MKIGLIVHAGWSVGGDGYDINFYNDKIKDFDKVFITMPLVDKEMKRRLFTQDIDDMLNYIFDKDETAKGYLSRIYNVEHLLKPMLSMKRYLISNTPKVHVKIGKVTGIYKRPCESPKQIMKKYLLKEYDNVNRSKLFDILFVGDYSPIPGLSDELIKFKDQFKHNDKVEVLEFGGLDLTKMFLDYLFINGKIVKPGDKLYIFGEFYNQCVKSITNLFKNLDMGIEYETLPEYSTLNKATNYDKGLEDKCFYVTTTR
jgi:hypothetical protein